MADLMEVDQALIVRPNAVWLHGVDNLSTKEVKEYVKLHVQHDFKVEWINDSSLNIVFEEDSEAQEALSKLSTTEVTNIEEERPIKSMEIQKDQELTARISNTGDKKVKNAAQYSRYYLFNPQEEKKYRKRDDYRERQPVRRRRSNVDEELFPSKASEFITPDEDLINEENEVKKKDDHEEDLFSRIGTKGDLGSRVGDSDKIKNQKTHKGDLDSRISSNDGSGDLFSRIGNKKKSLNSNAPE